MSTAMNFGSKSFQPRPPDKGSFPLDHFGERPAAAGLLRRVSGRGSPPVAPCGPVGAGVRTRLQAADGTGAPGKTGIRRFDGWKTRGRN
ncbi:uncharacterized protein LOC125154584 isoform X3 [Prionailurus viverrinus]|uniref:uncharacterized protein LOC125154584 isoform X3 n=1 Tax=Prionailurus viverrinus TaxID=61388 RepID=UPI001FF109C5|nr:uncharacterized protein LOC125154584 isoform X3 [Prionailurus viverrinus]